MEGREYIKVELDKPEDTREELREMCGGDPSKFMEDLLANPGDKDGTLKQATELLIDGVTGLPFLNGVADPQKQEEIKRLAVQYQQSLEAAGKNFKGVPEQRAVQKEIKRKFEGIISEIMDMAA